MERCSELRSLIYGIVGSLVMRYRKGKCKNSRVLLRKRHIETLDTVVSRDKRDVNVLYVETHRYSIKT